MWTLQNWWQKYFHQETVTSLVMAVHSDFSLVMAVHSDFSLVVMAVHSDSSLVVMVVHSDSSLVVMAVHSDFRTGCSLFTTWPVDSVWLPREQNQVHNFRLPPATTINCSALNWCPCSQHRVEGVCPHQEYTPREDQELQCCELLTL